MTVPSTPVAADTRARFLTAIAEVIPADRIAEIHFFPPIRQGPIETGVAVVGAEPEPARAPEPVGADVDDAADAGEGTAAEDETADDETADDETADDSPYADEATPEPAPEPPRTRHVVFMARYRLTRKGPDRGKWESEVKAEADAPLITVEAVAKGVRARMNEESDPERLNGDQVRAILAEAEARRWQTTP